MSAKLNVGVKDKGRPILAPLTDRPVRLMPDGVAGIVYGGDVYPVHEGDYIDLSDRSIPKSQCPKFLLTGRPVPYLPSPKAAKHSHAKALVTKWNVETNHYGNYLVFDGDEETAEQVVALMRTSGLGVRRWDVSSRPAADGYEYDWFVRLKYEGSNADCRQRIADALSGPPTGGTTTKRRHPDPESIDPHDLAAIVEMAREQLQPAIKALQAQAHAALARAEEAEAALKGVVRERDLADAASKAAVTELEQERAAATRLQKRLKTAETRATTAESAADALRQIPPSTPASAPGLEVLVSELQATVTALQRERDDAMQAWIDSDAKVADLSHLRDVAGAEAENLRAQVTGMGDLLERAEADLAIARRDAIDASGARPGNGGRDKGLGITTLLRRAWPRLVLHPDCLEVMAESFSRLTSLFALLTDLNAQAAVPASSWNNHKEVFEVDQHIATGRDGLGRVYYRRLSDGRLWVLVHRKVDDKEQERTVKRFAALDLQRADVDF